MVFQLEGNNNLLREIRKATKIQPMDRRTWGQFRNICKDLGVALTKKKEYSKSIKYLHEAIKLIKIGRRRVFPGSELLEQVYFYLAGFGSEDPNTDIKEVELNLKKGLSVSRMGYRYYNKLIELKAELFGKKSDSKRHFGFIRFYNIKKKYGFIYVGNISYFFHMSVRHLGLEKCFDRKMEIRLSSNIKISTSEC